MEEEIKADLKQITLTLNKGFVFKVVGVVLVLSFVIGSGYFIYGLRKQVNQNTLNIQQIVDFLNAQIKAVQEQQQKLGAQQPPEPTPAPVEPPPPPPPPSPRQ